MDRRRMMVDSGLVALLGFWLILAPLIFSYGATSAVWNGTVVGTLLLLAAGSKAVGVWRSPVLSWITFLLGAWVVLAPFLLGYASVTALRWNGIIVGLLTMVLSWRSATASTRGKGAG